MCYVLECSNCVSFKRHYIMMTWAYPSWGEQT